MKNLKKIGALLMAAVLTMALSVPAFAVVTMDNDGVLGAKDISPALGDVLNIPKTLKVFNPDESEVAAPNITYSYSIEAGSADILITDADSVQALTKSPTAAQMPTITGSLSWSSANTLLGAAVNGDNTTANNIQNVVVTFNSAKLDAAGIYRYKIIETVEYEGTGVTPGIDTDHELFLDVFVKDTDDDTPGQYIYGYVLHTGDDSIDGKTPTNVDTKTPGFVYDEYHTSNVTVSKTLSGDAAMKSHKFPMAVTITEGSVTNGFHLLTKANGSATVGAPADKTYTDNAQIAHGGSVKYIGLPTGSTFSVTETNDVLGTTYSVSHSIDGADAIDDGMKYTDETASTDVTTVSADKAHTVAWTNTLEVISPTGVALRVAPYVLMMAAGAVLLLFARRFRRAEAEG